MKLLFFIAFVSAFVISWILTFWVIRLAKRWKILDVPDEKRHFHKQPTPTLGGFAIFGSFLIVTFGMGILGRYLLHGNIPLRELAAIGASGLILMIGGFLDDKYQLPAKVSVIFPILASLTIILSGIHAVSVHNPFSGQVLLLSSTLSFVVVFAWTMTITYTTKLLDGVDGLVAGISAIGSLVLFGLSLTTAVMQPQTAFLAIVFAGSMLGFLIWNFHPAKIFLGEGGSTWAGFMLAILAIVSGGKIATALLIMGIPLLDMVWVVLRRLSLGQSPFAGDRKHLHFALKEVGLSERQIVLILYGLTAAFGVTSIFLQSLGKLVALVILVLVMLAIIASVFSVYRQRGRRYE